MFVKNRTFLVKMAILFLCVYLFQLIVKVAPGDDTWFRDISNQFSFFDYLNFRFNEWSGRIPVEAALYFFLNGKVWAWRILNTSLIISLGYLMLRTLKRKVLFQELLAVVLLLGFFSHSILSSGLLWITGSMNYLWPICGALFAMIPFADYLLRDEPEKNTIKLILSGFIGFISTHSNEQVALCMISFSVISIIVPLIKKKEINIKLIFLLLVYIIGALILFLAPGNSKRFISETATWFPGFDKLSLKDHVYVGTIWIFNKLFNEMKYIILLLSGVSTILVYRKMEDKKSFSYILVSISIVLFVIVLSVSLIDNIKFLFYDFSAIQKLDIGNGLLHFWRIGPHFFITLFPYIFWSIYLAVLICLVVLASDQKYFVLLCLLASIASMVVMFASPTIYASGNRVLTVSSVLILLVITNLIIKSNLLNNKAIWLIICTFSATNILSLFFNWLINGYSPIL